MTGSIAGVDVGSTNTDAVIVGRDGTIRERIKVPTTPDPAEGIVDALRQVVGGRSVTRVAFGTTHALNAIVRRQGLRRVALIRLGAPGTEAIPPLAGWPDDLTDAISAGAWIARGGVEIDGRHVDIDPAEIARIASAIVDDGTADSLAVVGTFSPLDPAQERRTAARLADATGLPVSISSEIGGLGLLQRENATVLNAALGALIHGLAIGLETATARLGEGVRAYLTQNDGTLMTIDHARRAPVLMVGAGPSNSLRGAAVLSGKDDVLVVDVGGTSADVGALVHRFPRESAAGVEIGGVQTNFRMPDLVSVPVGGGTIIRPDGSLGVDSVGARLTTEALVFGGGTPTLTDAAAAAGRVVVGDADRITDADTLAHGLAEAEERIVGAIDRMLLGSSEVDLVAVGGGSILLPDRLPGVRHIEHPADADVANAIGAALAPVAGEADFVADVSGDLRQRAMDRAVRLAGERAVAAGARADALEAIWIDEVPLAYVDRSVSRIRAKVAGPVAEAVP